MTDVFVDTSALIALVHSRDKYHSQAVEVAEQFQQARTHLVTTNLVMGEAVNLLKNWQLHHLAIRLMDSLQSARDQGSLELIFVDEQLWLLGWELMKQRPDKDWSLTDCISFVVMQDRGIQAALTADLHFAQAGFHPLLKR